ncbi:hypothetical protein BSP239C_04051 [Brevibacterium sp. 239c]|uniref:hypothetical protein n=1 Tax=Brevibacterium sp. 239c TaxID=1965356 RepID=UPI000C3DA9DC|nr:hypothetical protein [Brevibacterium sp. 239c]SMY05087.1 hypothetical protein BSP239C_04051 [Brevibacterium sp. 239c]
MTLRRKAITATTTAALTVGLCLGGAGIANAEPKVDGPTVHYSKSDVIEWQQTMGDVKGKCKWGVGAIGAIWGGAVGAVILGSIGQVGCNGPAQANKWFNKAEAQGCGLDMTTKPNPKSTGSYDRTITEYKLVC